MLCFVSFNYSLIVLFPFHIFDEFQYCVIAVTRQENSVIAGIEIIASNCVRSIYEHLMSGFRGHLNKHVEGRYHEGCAHDNH